jgi:hypothetical protein
MRSRRLIPASLPSPVCRSSLVKPWLLRRPHACGFIRGVRAPAELDLSGNPIWFKPECKHAIVAQLKSLRRYDDELVTELDRELSIEFSEGAPYPATLKWPWVRHRLEVTAGCRSCCTSGGYSAFHRACDTTCRRQSRTSEPGNWNPRIYCESTCAASSGDWECAPNPRR